MGRSPFVWILPILTLVLGIAIGRWWGDRDHATNRATAEQSAKGSERRLAPPPAAGAEPTRAPAPPPPSTPAAPSSNDVRLPTPPPKSAAPREVAPPAPTDAQPGTAATPKAATEKPPAGEPGAKSEDEGAVQMLSVLFKNPAFRQTMVDQMVAQVNERVKFSPAQLESAKKELATAMQPLVDLFAKGPVKMADLDPKFEEVKEDWKRRLTPLLTAEQGADFQAWVNEKHSLQVKMGMDQQGNPVDPDTPDHK